VIVDGCKVSEWIVGVNDDCTLIGLVENEGVPQRRRKQRLRQVEGKEQRNLTTGQCLGLKKRKLIDNGRGILARRVLSLTQDAAKA
jgi:hypothetical protein